MFLWILEWVFCIGGFDLYEVFSKAGEIDNIVILNDLNNNINDDNLFDSKIFSSKEEIDELFSNDVKESEFDWKKEMDDLFHHWRK